MHCHCGTNSRAPRWTLTDPCKPEVRSGAREESASPAWLAAPAMRIAEWMLTKLGRDEVLMARHMHKDVLAINTWQFNSAKTIFAFSCPPQLRHRAKLFVSCCRSYLVHQYTILSFSNLHLPGEIFTCKGVKS